MEYRHLGRSGLQVSALSFGSWVTFASDIGLEEVKQCMRQAYEHGVNFFDNAEAYAGGASELLMGEALKDFHREDLVVSTKVFWGGAAPNATGLSWKHVIEGTKNSLNRMQLDYVDLLFCHRPDPSTPIEETVRAMDVLVKEGLVFYWGTSEWSAQEITQAYEIAYAIGATPPSMEQPEYNLFHRERVEQEYASLYQTHGLGTTIWSPLASGVLTGKYNNGVPKESRLGRHPELQSCLTDERIAKVKEWTRITDELGCSMAQLAIAWCLKNPHVSTVITGATSVEQVDENMNSMQYVSKLTEDIMEKLN